MSEENKVIEKVSKMFPYKIKKVVVGLTKMLMRKQNDLPVKYCPLCEQKLSVKSDLLK